MQSGTNTNHRRLDLYVFYQFLHPDQIVSSLLLSEFCQAMAASGWDVTAFPANRQSDDGNASFPLREGWDGVSLRRIWRPAWRQSTSTGRTANALWMLLHWMMLAFVTVDSPDVIVIGTDPFFSVLIAPVWRWCHPSTRIVHWCFDLYPEAIYADRSIDHRSLIPRTMRLLMQASYRACDLVADLGQCMAGLLRGYDPQMNLVTMVPWALSEPTVPLPTAKVERAAIFGDATLALMYSGSFGRAHSSDDMLALMRHLRGESAVLALSVKGNRAAHLREQVSPEDTNIRFVPFAATNALEERLSSADVHILSLRDSWVGAVVPSKFFGALAVGRPVLFCGPRNCAIAHWIERYGLGWVLEPGEAAGVADQMRELLHDSAALQAMRERCYKAYREHFSRQVTITEWQRILAALIASPHLRDEY
ncbi:Glycosyltransferase involved in cell wall bisynthesis [Terriglobus roseus]|uniref:Glycosyltransferase involved in cell wall bisynthesis n=2 Tax=Terriglobus roseus TaxID=392734 RepID=A0A1H4NG57_9BACT|nr:Glycosyltransferase involved in cell wall bisynthesis [Terriglobus roseus]